MMAAKVAHERHVATHEQRVIDDPVFRFHEVLTQSLAVSTPRVGSPAAGPPVGIVSMGA